jgi:hypothetical protein
MFVLLEIVVGIRSPAMKHIEDVVSMAEQQQSSPPQLVEALDVEKLGSAIQTEMPKDLPSKKKNVHRVQLTFTNTFEHIYIYTYTRMYSYECEMFSMSHVSNFHSVADDIH